MIVDLLILIAGLVLILAGANILTEGAAATAKKMGVSEMVIGLTVVAFGTSAPELVISVTSAVQGSAGLAIGNVVGSNIFNILVIIGVVSMIRPLQVERSVLSNDLPLVILSSVALIICAGGVILDGASENIISRSDGLLLLLFFCIFMRYTFAVAKDMPSQASAEEPVKDMSGWKAALYIIGGLAGLVFGGDIFLRGATSLARALSMSEAVIGITIVAAGTSLPELAASVTAAVKRRPGLAVGNVVGSCIFNVFMVLGASATISPLPLGGVTAFDLTTMLAASVIFWLFGHAIGKRTFTRTEGALMFACYIAYMAILLYKL